MPLHGVTICVQCREVKKSWAVLFCFIREEAGRCQGCTTSRQTNKIKNSCKPIMELRELARWMYPSLSRPRQADTLNEGKGEKKITFDDP